MADPVQTIQAAMTPAAAPTTWSALVDAIAEVAASPSPAGEEALVQLLQVPGTLSLAGGYMPHSQSPEDMIRTAAIDALYQIAGPKYAAVCREAAVATASPIVKRIVAARFPG